MALGVEQMAVQTNSQFLSQLIQLSEYRQKRYATDRPNNNVDWSLYQKRRYAYATAAKGYGYRMALMGFDFTDIEEKRRKFQWWLTQQGVDGDTAYNEATRLNHSWEFAAHNHGKQYMEALDPWLGALDMTPGSTGLKLFEHYKQVRKGDAHEEKGQGSEAQSETASGEAKEDEVARHNIFLPADATCDVQQTAQLLAEKDAEIERLRIRACEMLVDDVEEHFSAKEVELDVLRKKNEQLGKEIQRLNNLLDYGWDESKHPRQPAGDEKGGEFAPGEGGPGIVVRSDGPKAREAIDNVDTKFTRPNHLYRGMTEAEYHNTVGKGLGVKSGNDFSLTGEGTSFGEDFATSESYVNYGRTDPRKTGRPTYIVEVKKTPAMTRNRQGYWYAHDVVPIDQITRIWIIEPKGEDLIAREVKTSKHEQRNHTAAESRTDFQAIKNIYDNDALRLSAMLRAYIAQARDALVALVERQAAAGPLSAEFAQSLRVSTGAEFAKDVEAYLMDVWRKNRDAAIAELPEKLRTKLQGMKRYAEWDESKHPRHPAGDEQGGEFAPGEGGSVDAKGRWQKPGDQGNGTFLLYHGTNQDLKELSLEHAGARDFGNLGLGIYLSDSPELADRYAQANAEKAGHPHTLNVVVKANKLFDFTDKGAMAKLKSDTGVSFPIDPKDAASSRKITEYLRSHGYEGGRMVNEFVIFNPAKVRVRHSVKLPLGKHRMDTQAEEDDIRNKFKKLKIEGKASGIWFESDSEQHDYAVAFRPNVAGNYFHNRALLLRGIVDDELTRDAKFSIFETLKGGRTMNEAIGDLRSIFEPWLGDPAKIEPSGISQTEEDILKPYRLENIVRTESTTAVAQGRAAVADAAADYVVGFQHSSILDMRTTEVCQLADGITFKKDDPRAIKLLPPLHFNCRSIDTFVTSDDDVEWTSEEDLDAVVRLIMPEFK